MTPLTLTIVIAFYLVATVSLLCLLFAQASPLLVIYFRKKYSEDQVSSAKKHLSASALVFIVLFSQLQGISFTSAGINTIVVLVSAISSIYLAIFSFHLSPKQLGKSIGIGAIIGTLFLTLYLLFSPLVFDFSPKMVELEDGVVCRQSEYGSAASLNGSTIRIFKRYQFIDKLVGQKDSNDAAINHRDGEVDLTITRCLDAFQNHPAQVR